MQRILLLVRNILNQGDNVPSGVAECLDAVNALMDEMRDSLPHVKSGKRISAHETFNYRETFANNHEQHR